MVTNLTGDNKRSLAVLQKSENDEEITGYSGQRKNGSESSFVVEIKGSKSTIEQERTKITSEDATNNKQSYKNFCKHNKLDKTHASQKSVPVRVSNNKSKKNIENFQL